MNPFAVLAGVVAQKTITDMIVDIPYTISYYDALFLIPALAVWLIFYGDRGRTTPLWRGGASVLFSMFWLTETVTYLEPEHLDVINAILSSVGVLFFLFIAYHFYLDYKWKENTKSLIWLVRTATITGSFYFVFEHIPVTQGAMIFVVAWLTYYVLIFFGNPVTIQTGFPLEFNEGIFIYSDQTNDISIRIVFACTAALALFLFAAAIIATETDRNEWLPWAKKEVVRTRGTRKFSERMRRNGILNIMKMSDMRRKATVFMIVIPIIFVTNIFRNVGVIIATYSGLLDFYTAHSIVAKIMSLVMMMFLTWILFEYLPELQENLMGLFDLTKRVKSGMIVDGRMDMKFIRGKKRVEEKDTG
ncbi:MAG: hypothetical protein ACMUIG_05580 [Thermoplasmatota archaeon]